MTFYRRDTRPRHVSTNMDILNNFKEILLERARQRAMARYDNMQYWFKVYPSCPPSTLVHARGGIMYESPDGPGFGRGIIVEPGDAEFGLGGLAGGAPAFTNAYYYRGTCLVIDGVAWADSDVGLAFYHDVNEYATAAEAEEEVWPEVMDTWGPYLSELPLVLIILRNNGTTGSLGQIQEIDAVNRGRSYIYHDVRPRYMVSRQILP